LTGGIHLNDCARNYCSAYTRDKGTDLARTVDAYGAVLAGNTFVADVDIVITSSDVMATAIAQRDVVVTGAVS
jgi:hypothetical protein